LIDLIKQLAGKVEFHQPINPDEIKLVKLLGKGGIGEVWKGVWNGEVYAIKKFNIEGLGFSEKEFKSEVLIMRFVEKQKNIVDGSYSQTDY
jgi:serine/threonine protein kinase